MLSSSSKAVSVQVWDIAVAQLSKTSTKEASLQRSQLLPLKNLTHMIFTSQRKLLTTVLINNCKEKTLSSQLSVWKEFVLLKIIFN
jgi:hypothetical protein